MATSARRLDALRRGLTLTLVASLTIPLPLQAAVPAPTCGVVTQSPPVDNRDGYFVNLEEAPLRPLALGSDGVTLFALNIPDARVVVFDVTNPLAPQAVGDVGVGLGPVSIVLRPGTDADPRELWVACQSSNAVFVLDESTRRVKDVIRLKGEPTGIAFDANGDFAYVSLAAVDLIARVDAANPHAPAMLLPFASLTRPGASQVARVPEPRALFVEGQDLYALSFQSGNGSFPMAFDLFNPPIVDGWQANALFPTLIPVPPDRDVLRFDLSNPAAPAVNALWRMGTLNFDLLRGGPANDVYVSNVDFTNATIDFAPPSIPVLDSEADYRKQGFVVHAVTHGQPGSGAPGVAQRIDLNTNVLSGLKTQGYRCAVPNQLALSGDGTRLFVACYETQNAAVIDLASNQVVAELRGGSTSTDPFGARGLLVNGNALYLYQRGDHSLQTFDLAGLASGSVRLPVPGTTRRIGFDVTSRVVRNGRRHFLNAANSASGLATCNTCHMDGHLDGIAWNLSDATGAEDAVPRVPKGTKVTMSLRGIEETPPFHWRGDRADLANFNPAFQGLLGGTQLAQTPDPSDDDALAEFEAFVFSLSYPANPNLADDRTYSNNAQLGFHCFSTHPTHLVSTDTDGVAGLASGQLNVTCADCHSMAGASGTLNQVNNPVTFVLADDATQLRGLWDKESEPIAYANFSPPQQTFLNTLPASGWGFGNSAFTFSVADFVNLGVFGFPAGVKPKVTQFLEEFDTGVAPAAAFAYAVTGSAAPEETLLTTQANARHIDLIVRGTVQIGLLANVPVGGQWNGTTFLLDRSTGAVTQLTLANLHTHVQNGTGRFTLIGTPVGMGYRLGRDRDMDFRLDGDEALAPATSTSNPDSDGDGFPDGYEIRLGSNPTLASSTPIDNVAPNVTSSLVAWRNSNVMKVRFTTDEESRSRLRVFRVPGGGLPLQFVREFHENQFKKEHVLVARGLRPGDTYRGVIVTEDPSGRSSSTTLPDQVLQDQLFRAGLVRGTRLLHLGPSPSGGTQRYAASFSLVNEDGAALPNATLAFKLVEWVNACTGSGCNTETNFCTHATGCTLSASSDAAGNLTVTFDGQATSLSAASAEVFVTDVVDPNKRLYFHSLDGQFGHWSRVAVP